MCVILGIAVAGKSLRENDQRAVSDPNYGLVYTVGEAYTSSRDDHTGPMMHLWASRRNAELDLMRPALADETLPVEERPIISLEQYARGVDPKRFKRWNVIVIIVESLRTDQLVVCGGKRIVMPHVEALAREGVVFPNNYTQASHSNYADLCPLSSHYPLRSPRTHVYPKNPTYPRVLIYDVLKHLGYRTAVISSQNENWGGMVNYLRTSGLDYFVDATTFKGPTYVPRGDYGFARFVTGEKRSGKIDDRFTVGEMIRWIDEKPDQPFFIYTNLQNSHVPFETPADFPRPFGRDDLPFNIGFNNFPRDKRDEVMNQYADSLAYMDSRLAKLFAHIKKLGLWDRTVIVVTGDTGQAFYEHGFAGHANLLLNEVMKVPLVIRAPGMTGKVDDRLAEHVDVPPSVFSLLGLPPHPSFQGTNLFTASPKKNRSVYLVAQCPLSHQAAIVRGGYKLIYDIREKRHILFDLNVDPGEFKGKRGLQSELAKALAVRLDTWRKIQLDYYADRSRQQKYYPPILKD